MTPRARHTLDGNEAAASIAYRLSEVIAIYPITPSSTMGELADEWSSAGRKNLWDGVPTVVEMQSEGGAAGAFHGALQAGALATSFTASQGLLLMIPNLYKIAGELTPFVLHVSARALATHALSIFGDHSDVMACRQTGCAMLASGSVQEAHDLALAAHLATLRSRVPFLHFFDGFRTSHELASIETLDDETLRSLFGEPSGARRGASEQAAPARMPDNYDELVTAHRLRALSPDHPVLRGTAQNPDVFFQAREASNPFYDHCPDTVERVLGEIAARTGRAYRLFDYVGHPEAERVIVQMGSGAEVTHELVEHLVARGERVGLVKVRLYRPFSVERFVDALPKTTRAIAVLDRTKEPGAVGEPLYLDVVAALAEARETGRTSRVPSVIGGRYGLASKEYTPAMALAVFDELNKSSSKRRFTVGIVDDVTHLSLPVDAHFSIEPADVTRAVFYGLGADGTVSANKNSIKIIAEATGQFGQGYFVYDSKKSGTMTTSHLRFGPRAIRSSYLVREAGLVAVHQFDFLDRYDCLELAADGGTLLLNAPYPADRVWGALSAEVQRRILDKRLRLFAIDAATVAADAGMGGRINTIMQACFFAIAGVMPKAQAIAAIKQGIAKSYGKKGEALVASNYAAVDKALDALHEIAIPHNVTSLRHQPPTVSPAAPDFVQRVTAVMLAGHGDLLPVSAFPVDGTWPTGTAKWEKRNIALEIPTWDEAICIQCNKCALVCPHAAIRAKVYPKESLDGAPAAFKSMAWKGGEFADGARYTIQVAPEDCTGCSLCAVVCPAKDKSNPRHKSLEMHPQRPLRDVERDNYDFFLALPEAPRDHVKRDVKGVQLLQPLFEYSGACAGCGETPYLKLLTQLFGDRLVIANATGCSSIYGGNLPTTPYTTDASGRGPAWSNSLFEDNAEFGLGMRLAIDHHTDLARALVRKLAPRVGESLATAILDGPQASEAEIAAQRARVGELRRMLAPWDDVEARRLAELSDALVKKSVWIVGGDGWAYDIGYGGLDHVLASRHDVKVLVLDTEVYSNTGGQQSKATPLGAAAKFAVAGKASPKKDLGLLAMTYGHVYVAQVAMGAKDVQTVRAFEEADSYPGPALIIAYSHCIAHGYDLCAGAEQQKLAVESAYWPLYRFDPRRAHAGETALRLDSSAPRGDLATYMRNETRFRIVEQRDPARWKELLADAKHAIRDRWALYERLAAPVLGRVEGPTAGVSGDGKPTLKAGA